MKEDFLFAIDSNTKEVIVSCSKKGSNKVDFIERIKQSQNAILYNAVNTLTSITDSSDFDIKFFKSMDKVCHMVYKKHKKLDD